MAKRGLAPHLKVGRRVLFNPDSIDKWLRGLETGGTKPEDPPEGGVLRRVQP